MRTKVWAYPEIVRAVEAFQQRTGRWPTRTDFREDGRLPSLRTLRRRAAALTDHLALWGLRFATTPEARQAVRQRNAAYARQVRQAKAVARQEVNLANLAKIMETL